MVKSQKEKLLNLAGGPISIGIINAGEMPKVVPIPWEGATQSFEVRQPDVYLTARDLNNAEILNLLDLSRVVGCYIWAPIEDYSIISRFEYLEDLCIKNADFMQNLNFLSSLKCCKMLYLQGAKLNDLNKIIELKKANKENFKYLSCIALDNCEIEDVSIFEKEEIHFIEFLVYKSKGKNEKSRWKNVSAVRRRYYAN